MPRRLTDDRIIEILEDIAENGKNAAAKIAAIRALREMERGEQPISDAWAKLDELAPRRAYRTK